jgi:hypothetical protein
MIKKLFSINLLFIVWMSLISCSNLLSYEDMEKDGQENSIIEDETEDKEWPASWFTYNILDKKVTITGFSDERDTSKTDLVIPETIEGFPVTVIGGSAFELCNLTSVDMPNSVTKIDHAAFCYCRHLGAVSLSNSVTSIGSNAFNSSSIELIDFPSSMKEINFFAFNNCSKLTLVNIPDSVTYIGQGAFEKCTNLASVNISASVTIIRLQAFLNCSSLTSVYVYAATPPGLSLDFASSTFAYNASGRKIYVPAASVDSYKTASGWNIYADDIVGM